MHHREHMQLIWRQFRYLPRQERLVIFDDALRQRQVIEALEYPIPESFIEYKQRVSRELGV